MFRHHFRVDRIADFRRVTLALGTLTGDSVAARVLVDSVGATIARVVGEMGTAGGHGKMAGAQISLDHSGPDVGEELRRRFLAELGKDPDTKPQSLIRKQG